MSELVIPIDWRPRVYQQSAWDALQGGTSRCCLVWHRRAGKDLFTINWISTQLFQRIGLYWHVLPTYRQGRKVVWEGKTRTGRSFLSHLPMDIATRVRDDEMSVWFPNPYEPARPGSLYQVVGADDADRLVGANPVGIVFSEWSLMSRKVWDLTRPILAENGGWAVFIYTPRGRNHGWTLYQNALEHEGWYAERLGADVTHAISEEDIEDERRAGMPEELIQQEFYCSFDAPLVGSYYGEQMSQALKDGRIGKVPWEPNAPVTTAWDLGLRDATAIWFAQVVGKEIRLIDYYYATGMGLDHYAKVLYEKPYAYDRHLVPHDATVRELGTGKSRVEMLRELGIRVKVGKKLPVQDGIAACRALIPRCWFDEKHTETGIRALREYTKERIEGETDPDGNPIYRDKPKHDWTSHPADAFRTLATGLREHRTSAEPIRKKLAIA